MWKDRKVKIYILISSIGQMSFQRRPEMQIYRPGQARGRKATGSDQTEPEKEKEGGEWWKRGRRQKDKGTQGWI